MHRVPAAPVAIDQALGVSAIELVLATLATPVRLAPGRRWRRWRTAWRIRRADGDGEAALVSGGAAPDTEAVPLEALLHRVAANAQHLQCHTCTRRPAYQRGAGA